jgi:hypothetical protein
MTHLLKSFSGQFSRTAMAESAPSISGADGGESHMNFANEGAYFLKL